MDYSDKHLDHKLQATFPTGPTHHPWAMEHPFPALLEFMERSIATEELKQPAGVFREAAIRLQALGYLPMRIAYLVEGVTRLSAEAAMDITGKTTDHNSEEVMAIASALSQKIQRWQLILAYKDGEPLRLLMDGVNWVQRCVELEAALVNRGIESWLMSMVVGAWTTFEAFAVDLWEAALNVDPMLSIQAALANPSKQDADAGEEVVKRDAGMSLTILELKDAGFNVSQKMGTVLKRARKFNFNRLEGIEAAFAYPFGPSDVQAIFAHPKHERLTVLEGLRNVLVHNGGVVDEKFRERATKSKKSKTVYGDLASLNVGDPVPVDGTTVREFMDVTISAAAALLNLVDTRLNARPMKANT